MAAQKCKECERRPKMPGRHRCATCFLRHLPIGDQVAEARRRLAMVPEELRLKRTKKIQALAPEGTAFCAGCQSFRDLEDFGKSATQCRACVSAASHSASIEKTYGLTSEQYEELLRRQGGKCAICRARPKSKRLAVDHDHKTGEVLGLLCSRCNHDLKGSAWDSLAMATALWHYMNTPPASGHWIAPENAPQLMPVESAVRPSPASGGDMAIVGNHSAKRSGAATGAAEEAECVRTHYLPVGWVPVEGKIGVYYVEDTPGTDAPF